MVEPFSTNDIFYVNATNCNSNSSSSECTYKKNVDLLNELKVTSDTAKQQYKDLTEEQSAIIMSNIGLGIGIFAMLWIMQVN